MKWVALALLLFLPGCLVYTDKVAFAVGKAYIYRSTDEVVVETCGTTMIAGEALKSLASIALGLLGKTAPERSEQELKETRCGMHLMVEEGELDESLVLEVLDAEEE